MLLRRAFFAGLLIFSPQFGHAATTTPPPAGASAVEVMKFVIHYEEHASDETQLLRGKSDKPTTLETLLFTRDFLTAWYALKAKEAPDSNPGSDNVTNGETDYIVDPGVAGEAPNSVGFKDMSDTLNGVMVGMTYRTNGSYATLFFLKQEDGRLKIDDITLAPFVAHNFNPKAVHRPGVSEGIRKDIAKALNHFGALKR